MHQQVCIATKQPSWQLLILYELKQKANHHLHSLQAEVDADSKSHASDSSCRRRRAHKSWLGKQGNSILRNHHKLLLEYKVKLNMYAAYLYVVLWCPPWSDRSRCRDLLAADNKAYLRLIARLTYISHYERFGDLSTVL